MTDDEKAIARELSKLEREWLTGWTGPTGAAFNAIGEGMTERGLTINASNWNPNAKGKRVRQYIMEMDDE